MKCDVRMKGRNEMGGATCMQEVYEEGSPPCQLYSSRNKGGNAQAGYLKINRNLSFVSFKECPM